MFTECIIGQGPVHRSSRFMKNGKISGDPFKKTLKTYRKDLSDDFCVIQITQRKDGAMQIKIGILLRNLLCQ